jgi:hypothetical protein
MPSPRKAKQKEPKTMTELNPNTATDDDLASLGLGDETATEAPAEKANTDLAIEPNPVPHTAPEADKATEEGTVAKQTREHVEVGEVTLEEDVPLTALTRQTGGSKYRFNDLREPVKKEDGSFSYASFKVDLLDGVDEGKLKRSVQSATTQANRQAKGGKGGYEKHDVYYITRSVMKDGKFAGVRVYRVDGTVAKEG